MKRKLTPEIWEFAKELLAEGCSLKVIMIGIKAKFDVDITVARLSQKFKKEKNVQV